MTTPRLQAEFTTLLETHVANLTVTGSQAKGCVPWREDKHPSLDANLEKCVWYDHARNEGGNVKDFKARLGLNGTKPSAQKIIATYDYRDESNTLLFQVVRYENKHFIQRRPDGKGGWIYNLHGVRRVLYRLPEILDKETVYVNEGEKDAERLWALDLPATTNPGGAGKWRAEYNQYFADKHVVIFADNDETGEQHAQDVAKNLLPVAASVKIVRLSSLPPKGDVSDWLDARHTKEELHTVIAATPAVKPADLKAEPRNGQDHESLNWQSRLMRGKEGRPLETLRNLTLALCNIEPWASSCWYDSVRDLAMIGEHELSEETLVQVGLAIEETSGIPMRSRSLLADALRYHCHQCPRDLLREWLDQVPAWDGIDRLSYWLSDFANTPNTPYCHDISRLLIVALVARALQPGCQYRSVIILEGPENAGKTKLVRALATPEWYREVSHGLDGKEAHMRIRRAWVAELAELSSMSKTEESRLKSFFTIEEDTYIPKYSNLETRHKRRTVFIGTVNPEGDNTYLRGQSGNTRYLPIAVQEIDVTGFEAVREQLFAEALAFYRAHPTDWWRLSDAGEAEAQDVREDRRQRGLYETALQAWLDEHQINCTWWEDIAERYLRLSPDKWTRPLQMEVAKALAALNWEKGKRERIDRKRVYPWRRPKEVVPT